MKVLLVILDGLPDRPIPAFDLSTPLQIAATPNLDRLAAAGINGFMHPIAPGIAPSTDLAHFIILGYQPQEYPGRAAIEALGEEHPLRPGQVVMRTSFISVQEESGVFNIKGRDIPVAEEEMETLVDLVKPSLIGDIKVDFLYSGKRQGFLFLEGADASVCDSDPFDSNLPVIAVQPLIDAQDSLIAEKTARCLNRFMLETYEQLDHHPGNAQRRESGLFPLNFLVTKWPSRPDMLSSLDTFAEKHAMRGSIVAGGVLLKGIAYAAGIDFFSQDDSSHPAESLRKRCLKALELLESDYDFVLVHTKAADEAAHTKDPEAKRRVIEELDAGLAPLLKNRVFGEILTVVTADHTTPSVGSLIHSGEPVPLLLAGPGIRSDEVTHFDESSCRKGELGCISGRDLMPLILNYTDRAKYLGSRSFARDFPARPTRQRIVPLTARLREE